ncbi:MAG TPA: hypothetical protein H9747_03830 [Candidatus Blautia stercorigallinarum]|uniref:Endo-alpha-N-acetylgalactosaminidase glycoside hydrolase n=1 Tax=Candidatus Blautia stercorigallinarum TaxID=2838501 RepID=A0A9D1TEQ1_9FIRM|nr:hypothetical protein [Candidatus Blautia stercorigallinarum]
MDSIIKGGTEITFDKTTLRFSFQKEDGCRWRWDKSYMPYMECRSGNIFFHDAGEITHELLHTGVGEGILSTYCGFKKEGKIMPYKFQTLVWVEEATGDVYCEWIPLCEEGLEVKKVFWPGPMEFEEKKGSWYTLLTHQQGILIPNTWEVEFQTPVFDGMFGTAGAYMPWFAQVRDGEGYLAVCVTPWNSGYQAEHPAGGPYTRVSMRFEPSLGKMDYRRIVKYTFLKECDHNTICKTYRNYVEEQGRLRTLAEKAIRNPSIDRLIGCAFLHKGIKTFVQPDSDFYDPEKPEKNNHLTTFAQREQEIRQLHEMGVEKLYLHLDGWAEPGYDNRHPDYGPACKEAGGWEGMKSLVDTMHKYGYLFGIHDQYRDYYLSAPSFDENFACRLPDGTIPRHKRWAGGPQSYLCATQAPYYVKRNFKALEDHGIRLDCAYLDVFTCNEGDECDNPLHRMTRKECYEHRARCFRYLLKKGILPSSEEVNDWAVTSQVFCHYAPYDFMMRAPGTPKQGIPVPLYNLVYHDCVIQPWMMEKISEEEDYMLYALLNGGAPYLVRDGAYPNTDGAFEDRVEMTLEECITRAKVVSDLHEKVGKCQMVRHEFVEGNPQVQKTVFSNGISVQVDFQKQTYEIRNENYFSE